MAIITGIRGAGNGVSANQKPDIWQSLMILKPYETPAMQFAFFSGKKTKEVSNKMGKYSWFEKKTFPDSTTTRDRKSTRLNSSHIPLSRMPSSA